MYRCKTVLAVALTLVATACSSGGDLDEVGAGPTTSIDQSKLASSLSNEEATEFCEDVQRYVTEQVAGSDMTHMVCSSGALRAEDKAVFFDEPDKATSTADLRAKCNEAYAACMEDPGMVPTLVYPNGGNKPESCAAAAEKLTSCNATVGELSLCVRDLIADLKRKLTHDYCANAELTSSGVRSPEEAIRNCKILDAECPRLL